MCVCVYVCVCVGGGGGGIDEGRELHSNDEYCTMLSNRPSPQP